MNAADVMDEVVVRLVAAIEAGAGTWDMPWRSIGSTGWPANAATGNRYRTGAVWVFERREWVLRRPGRPRCRSRSVDRCGPGADIRVGVGAPSRQYALPLPASDPRGLAPAAPSPPICRASTAAPLRVEARCDPLFGGMALD
jgi:N-terminal domain of anti-restriction factor ArdC